jgi:FAD/FMN-containing dehydrogenase
MPSLGLMSFARPGVTLALDFPNDGARTLQLLESLDAITREAGGAVYPAKDARMSASSFRRYFPAWEQFQRYIDPKFSSSFWRRVTET